MRSIVALPLALCACGTQQSLVSNRDALPVAAIRGSTVTVHFSDGPPVDRNLFQEGRQTMDIVELTVTPDGIVDETVLRVGGMLKSGKSDIKTLRSAKHRLSAGGMKHLLEQAARLAPKSPETWTGQPPETWTGPVGCWVIQAGADAIGGVDFRSPKGAMSYFLLQAGCDTEQGRESRIVLKDIVRTLSPTDYSKTVLFRG
jgi:hypothetical protein